MTEEEKITNKELIQTIAELQGQVTVLVHACSGLMMMNPYRQIISKTLEPLIDQNQPKNPNSIKDIAYSRGITTVVTRLLNDADAASNTELLRDLSDPLKKHTDSNQWLSRHFTTALSRSTVPPSMQNHRSGLAS